MKKPSLKWPKQLTLSTMSFFKSLKAMFGGKAEAKAGECCDHGQHEEKVAEKCCADDKHGCAEEGCEDKANCSPEGCDDEKCCKPEAK